MIMLVRTNVHTQSSCQIPLKSISKPYPVQIRFRNSFGVLTFISSTLVANINITKQV